MDGVDDRTGIWYDFPDGRREIRVELPDPAQMRIYRSWSPTRRLEAAARMNRDVRRMVRAHIESLHPEWTSAEVDREMAKRFLGDAFPLWEKAMRLRELEEHGE